MMFYGLWDRPDEKPAQTDSGTAMPALSAPPPAQGVNAVAAFDSLNHG